MWRPWELEDLAPTYFQNRKATGQPQALVSRPREADEKQA